MPDELLCDSMGWCLQHLPSHKGVFHDNASAIDERGYAGAESLTAHSGFVSPASLAICALLRQITRPIGSRTHSHLLDLSNKREETGTRFDPHRYCGASLLLQGYAQEGLDIPRGPTPTKEAAEVAPHPQPRGGAAFPPLCTPT